MLNSFEVSILRILLKRNGRPIPVFTLIEGFPNNSENNVIESINYLRKLDYVNISSGFPMEEEFITFNSERRAEILDIVNLSDETKVNRITLSAKYEASRRDLLPIPITISSRTGSLLATSKLGIACIITLTFFLIGGPLILQIPSANNEISADSSLNMMNNYLNYHKVFGDKGRHHSAETVDAVGKNYESASRLILTSEGAFLSPFSCKQS